MSENKQFNLQRIYLKDASLEVPHAPTIFQQAWKPKVDVQVNTQVQPLAAQKDHFEVELQVTVTASNAEQTAYIAEVKQAGVFTHQGLTDEELKPALGIHGPTSLFPYVRETVADLVMKASFPQFVLQPINFEAIYQQHVQQLQQAQNEAAQQPKH
jgi:preprotein translocase subunit SecB